MHTALLKSLLEIENKVNNCLKTIRGIYMKNGFIKVAAVTPKTKIADVNNNLSEIIGSTRKAVENGAKIIVFPELSITGYCCESLFLQDELINRVEEAVLKFKKYTENIDALVFVGTPYWLDYKLYNTMIAFNKGKILGILPKMYLPNYDEFAELRYFEPAFEGVREIEIDKELVPFGIKLLFENHRMKGLCVAAEICADLWTIIPPSSLAVQNGATIIVNSSASNEVVGKDLSREQILSAHTSRLIAGYIYSNPGNGESTENLIFNGHNIIAENGEILETKQCGTSGIVYSEIDIYRLLNLRNRNNNFKMSANSEYRRIKFNVENSYTNLTRRFNKSPFISTKANIKERQYMQLVNILTSALICQLRLNRNEIIELRGDNFNNLFLTMYTLSYIFRKNEVKKRKIVFKENILEKYEKLNDIAGSLGFEIVKQTEKSGLKIDTTSMTEYILGIEYVEYERNTYALLVNTPQSLIDQTIGFISDRIWTDGGVRNIIIKQSLSDKTGYEVEEFLIYNKIAFGFEAKKLFLLVLKTFRDEYTEEVLIQKFVFILKRLYEYKDKQEWLTGPKTVDISLDMKIGWSFPKTAEYSLEKNEISWLKRQKK